MLERADMPAEIWTDINGNATRTKFNGGVKYMRADLAQATIADLQGQVEALKADHTRVLQAVAKARYELAALFPAPDNPTIGEAMAVCGNNNKADAECIYLAYEALLEVPAQPAQGGAK